MSDAVITLLGIIGMLIVIAFGTPVAIAMLLISAGVMLVTVGPSFTLTTFQTLPYSVASNYNFAAIPMFILMGIIAGSTGIVADVYKVANMFLARVRGGLYMATTIASAAFGAVNGSTIVGAAVFTKIALPEMVALGYHRGISAGCIAAGGTFAAMIPPSIILILYGIVTNESIGQLLMAGIVPGILTVLVYLAGIWVMVRLKPAIAPAAIATHYSIKEKLQGFAKVGPVAVIAFVVIAGIYTGLVSTSAAGAVGAACVLAFGLLMKRIRPNALAGCLSESILIATTLFFIVMGGMALSRLFLVTGFVDSILEAAAAYSVQPWMMIMFLVIAYLFLGMLMDGLSMLVMTVPIVHPIVVGLGYDPIWFAIIVVKLIELSCITPPVGINLFAVVSAGKRTISIKEVYAGIMPFILLEFIVLAFLLFIPQITLYLPNAMRF